MNTFVTDYSYADTAKCLDDKRLGKQRVETLQIVRYFVGADPEFPWKNHPAVLMWTRHAHELLRYGIAMCDEWVERGFVDTTGQRFRTILGWYSLKDTYDRKWPAWTADPRHHFAHRSNLLRKSASHYRKFWPTCPDDFPYIWWFYDIPSSMWIPGVHDMSGYARLLAFTQANTIGSPPCHGTASTPMDLSRKRISVIRGRSLSPPSA